MHTTASNTRSLVEWVRRTASLVRPDRVVWCDSTDNSLSRLVSPLLDDGTVFRLTATSVVGSPPTLSELPVSVAALPGSTLRRPLGGVLEGGPRDGVTLGEQVRVGFRDSMRGRTMYVVAFAAGVVEDGGTAVGVQLTDSPYVAAVLLSSYGPAAFQDADSGTCLLRAVHSVGRPLLPGRSPRHADALWPRHRHPWMARFPQQSETWSFGTAYEPRLASVVGAPIHTSAPSEHAAVSVA